MINQNHKLCEEAKLYYYDRLCDQSCGPVPQPVSNHIEQCQHCQKQINHLKIALSKKECFESGKRQDSSAVTTMLQLHFAYIGEHVTCETVRPFLPALLDPALEIRIPTPITVHLDHCRQCAEDLKAIQKLNLPTTQLYRLSRFFVKGPSWDTTEFSELAAVSAMAERADSEVVTIFHIDKSAKAREAAKSGELYTGFPISVEIIHSDDKVKKPTYTVDFAAALKEKVSAMNLKPFLKIVAAAAVLLIGFTLLLNTSSAKAVTIEKIYRALEIVKNVHILKSVPGKTELTKKITEEKWVSRTLNVSMSKTEKGFVLWDITNKVIKTRQLGASSSVETEMPEDLAAQMSRRIKTSFGLMPFYEMSEIPPGAQWLRVDDQFPEVAEGIEIYDLKWATRKYGGSSEFKIWRVFTDVKTSLPQKVEWYTKFDEDSVFVLETVMVVEYLDESAIRTVIEDTGF